MRIVCLCMGTICETSMKSGGASQANNGRCWDSCETETRQATKCSSELEVNDMVYDANIFCCRRRRLSGGSGTKLPASAEDVCRLLANLLA